MLSTPKDKTTRPTDNIRLALEQLDAASNGQIGFVSSTTAKMALEGYSDASKSSQENNIRGELQGLMTALEQIGENFYQVTKGRELTKGFSQAQLEAAGVSALMYGTDPRGYHNASQNGLRSLATEAMSTDSHMVRVLNSGPMLGRVSLESFDESEIRQMAKYTVVCNLCTAQQDEFGETFFPTVTIPADQAGFSISVRLMHVVSQNRTKHRKEGTFDGWGERNLTEANIDSTILNQTGNKLVPIYRDTVNTDNFNTEIGKFTAVVDSSQTPLDTGALVFGKLIDFLGVSQTDASLANGSNDSTDVIDGRANLRFVYLKTVNGGKTAFIRLDVSRFSQNNFVPAAQGFGRTMQLNFYTKSLAVTPSMTVFPSLAPFGAANGLDLLVTGKAMVTFDISVTGQLDLERGTVNLNRGNLTVRSVRNVETGEELAFSKPTDNGKQYADLFANAELVGYTLDAQKTVSNFREIDQMIVVREWTEITQLGLGMPIIVQRQHSDGDVNDAGDLAALITASRIMTANGGVTELLKAADYLSLVSSTHSPLRPTDIGGITRLLLPKPYFKRESFDVTTALNSQSSAGRAEDVRAAIVAKIRDMVFTMLRDSGYKAMADGMNGGPSKPPLVIIGTDQYTYRHLLVPGDFRLLADNIEVKLVYTQDDRMSNKIFITLGDPDGIGSNQPNPKHFGNMAFKPEIVGTMSVVRNGSHHKQLYCQPCFKHITHLPILAVLDVENLPGAVAAKTVVNYHQV